MLSQSNSSEVDYLVRDLPEQYLVVEKLSQGGMGSIYKVQNRYTQAQSAIKVLRPEAAQDPEAIQRFVFEARAASSLNHPHICRVFDFGVTRTGVPYLAMDWIDGITLERKIERGRNIPTSEAIFIFQQVASALAYAHRNKVIHRDIKPQNIMLRRDPMGRTEAYLVDFGIAKVLQDEDAMAKTQGLTQTGTVVGTPLYMSPEQAMGGVIDRRTDIYSLGCVMYYALSGKPPFAGKSAIDTITKHLSLLPSDFDPTLKVPPGLRMIIFKALEKKPEHRYSNMDEILADFKKLSKGVGLQHKPLAHERRSTRQKILLLVYFLLGFVIMYGLSIGLQNVLEPGQDAHRRITGEHSNGK